MTQSIRNFIFDYKEMGIFLLTALAVIGGILAIIIPSYFISLNVFGLSESVSILVGMGIAVVPAVATMVFVSGE